MTEVVLRLPDNETKSFIEEQVASGRFTDASDFILNLVDQARRHAVSERVD